MAEKTASESTWPAQLDVIADIRLQFEVPKERGHLTDRSDNPSIRGRVVFPQCGQDCCEISRVLTEGQAVRSRCHLLDWRVEAGVVEMVDAAAAENFDNIGGDSLFVLNLVQACFPMTSTDYRTPQLIVAGPMEVDRFLGEDEFIVRRYLQSCFIGV